MGYDMLARIGADISDFSRKMAMVQERLGEFGKFKGGLIGAGTLMAPSVIPMIAALAAGAGALGSAFVAAGAGAAVFGAVAVSNLGKIFEASKNAEAAQKKLDEATNAKERAAAMEELAAATAGFTDKQKEAFSALQDFKSFWDGFAKEFENPVLDVFIGSLNTLEGILNALKPAIAGTAHGFSYLLGLLNQSLNTEPMRQFFNFLGNNAESAIISLGIIFGDVLGGIMNLMVAFGPASMGMLDGLMNLTAGFYEWSKSVEQSEGFKQFMDYVSANAPVFISLIGNIISIIKSLVIAFAPFGQASLSALNAITGFIAGILNANPSIRTVIASITAAVGAFMLISPVVFKAIAIFGLFGKVLTMARTEGTLLARAIAFIVGPIGIAIGAILALIGIFVYLFNTNQQFHDQVMAVWTQIQGLFVSLMPTITALIQTFAGILSNVASVIFPLLAQAAQTILPLLSQMFQTTFMLILQVVLAVLPVIIGLIQTLIPIIIQIAMAVIPLILQAVQMVFPLVLQIIQAVLPVVIQLIQMLIPIIIQIAQQILPLIVQAAQQVFPVVLQLVQAAIPVVQAILEGLSSFIESVVIPTIEIILHVVESVFPAVQQIISSIIQVIIGIIEGFTALLQGDWEGAWNAVQSITEGVTGAINGIVDGAMNALIGIVEGIMSQLGVPFETNWEEVKSYLSGIDLSSIGANIIQGLIDGIGSMAGSVISKIQEVAGGIKEKMMSMLGIHSPSRWMRDMIGENMILGWIKGIEGMKQSVMGTVAAMTGWMQPDLSSVQLGYNVSGTDAIGAYTLPAATYTSKDQGAATAANNRPVVIENVMIMDSQEVARATSDHIDVMQGNKVSTKNYLRGRKVEHNR